MTLKKTLCMALAVMTISTASLTSCGKENSSTADTNSTEQTQTETASISDVADRLKNEVKFVDELNEFDAGKIEKFLGIKPDMYKEGKVYVGSGGATAEEIACFEANDADGADAIKAALEKRVEAQKVAFENYQPAEMEKLGAPVIKVKGNCVYMCISDENSKAEEIIG